MIRAEGMARLQPPPREIPTAVSWFVRLAHGIDVDEGGAWRLPTLSRLGRPAVIAVIAAASVGFLASAILEMVRQLVNAVR